MRRKKSFRHGLQIIGAYPVTGAGIRCCCFWKEAEVKAEARARFVDGGSVSIAAVSYYCVQPLVSFTSLRIVSKQSIKTTSAQVAFRIAANVSKRRCWAMTRIWRASSRPAGTTSSSRNHATTPAVRQGGSAALPTPPAWPSRHSTTARPPTSGAVGWSGAPAAALRTESESDQNQNQNQCGRPCRLHCRRRATGAA